MKNTTVVLITALLFFSGCTEFLTLPPQDELIREEYWKTEAHVENLLGHAYAKMADIMDNVYYWSELRGGLLSPREKSVKPETLEFFNFNINEYNNKVKWGHFYVVINLANTILEYAPLAKDNDDTFTELAYNGYIAEAYFLRSLCYFYLVKAFKDVPYITKSYSKDDQDFNYEKSNEQEIIESLIADLTGIEDKAFTLDYYNPGDPQRKGRANINAVYALLADIYLWNNNYQKCIEYCNKIDEFSYSLVDGEDYFSIYALNGNSSESIFELQFNYSQYNTTNKFSDQDNKDGDNLYSLTSNNSEGKKETNISDYTIELFELSDLRQYVDGSVNGGQVSFVTGNAFSLWKYEGNSPWRSTDRFRQDRQKYNSDANWIFYRYPDIILMKAEAHAETGDVTNALALLNIIRSRAGISPFTSTNPETVIKGILNERAREFIGEGKRWFDLVRVCRRDIDGRLPVISEAVISNVDPRSRSAVSTKLKDVNSWFLPIHFDELRLNKELVQNEFYD